MRQQPSGRRPRGRSNRKQYVPHRSQNFDSHGPEVRVRGNAMQVYEKYVNLARDATSAGDRIAAESYQQYAEHYFRIINDTTDPQRPAPERPTTDPQHPAPEHASSERTGSEPPEAERDAPERAAIEPPKGGRQPYPTDAEQPFVDGAAKTAASTAASTVASTAASEGNGQAPETKPAEEESSAPPVVDGEAEAAPVKKTDVKPRGRGRPRSRAKSGNGAATEDDAEEAATPASSAPGEAGEPTS